MKWDHRHNVGSERADVGALQERMNGNGPSLAPGISSQQRRLEREAELAAREDCGEPSDGAWAALGLVLLALAGFVAVVIMIVKLLRAHAGAPLLLLVLAVAGASGCARLQPAPVAVAQPVTVRAAPKPPEILVLSERIGGPVAFVLGQLEGQEPKAATLPYLPTVVLKPQDANDTCLMVHEGVHRIDQVDMGGATWGAEYLRELVECERGKPPAECLRSIPLEAKAYDAQHACERGGR